MILASVFGKSLLMFFKSDVKQFYTERLWTEPEANRVIIILAMRFLRKHRNAFWKQGLAIWSMDCCPYVFTPQTLISSSPVLWADANTDSLCLRSLTAPCFCASTGGMPFLGLRPWFPCWFLTFPDCRGSWAPSCSKKSAVNWKE